MVTIWLPWVIMEKNQNFKSKTTFLSLIIQINVTELHSVYGRERPGKKLLSLSVLSFLFQINHKKLKFYQKKVTLK